MAGVKTPPKPKQITLALREYRALELAPLAEGKPRVDRERGIVYGVKVAGRHSPNTHGVRGVEGTEYLPEAFAAALSLYEGAKVNCNHPPRNDPGRERLAEDRLGKLQNPRLIDGEPYADLHLLRSHPMAERVMEAAENGELQDCFAMSHNATGQGEVRQRKYVVTHIPEVKSVDLVADGGTNRSLFESKPMKTKVKALLEDKVMAALSAGRQKRLEAILTAPILNVLEAEDTGSGDHRDHLFSAMKSCQEAGDDEMAGKIHRLLKPDSPEEEEETPESEEPGTGPDKGPDKAPEEEYAKGKTTTESLQKRCRSLCDLAGLKPEADLLESLTELPTDAARIKMLAGVKKLTAPARGGARSQAPERPATESVADSKTFARRLLG